MKKENAFSAAWETYRKSIAGLKDYGNTSLIMLFDALFYPLLLVISLVFTALISATKFFIYTSLGSLILFTTMLFFLLSVIAAWSFSRALIWSRIAKKKFTAAYFWKLLTLNILWVLVSAVPVLVPAYFYSKSIRSESYTLLVEVFFLLAWFFILACLHFIVISCCLLSSKNNVWQSFISSIKLGTVRIRQFLAAYLFVALTLAAVSLVSLLLHFVSIPVQRIALFLMLFLYLAWARIYVNSVIKNNL